MGLFNRKQKPTNEEKKDNIKHVQFTDKEKEQHGIIPELQGMVATEDTRNRPDCYNSREEFANDLSNEDALAALYYKICTAKNTTITVNERETGEIKEYEISDEERAEIKEMIKNGNCRPTESINFESVETADIRVTLVESIEARERRKRAEGYNQKTSRNNTVKEQKAAENDKPDIILCGRFDYGSENNSILLAIPIDEGTVERYNDMIASEKFEDVRIQQYQKLLNEGFSSNDASIISQEKAKSIFKSIALQINAAEGKVYVTERSPKEQSNSFINQMDIRKDDVRARTAEGMIEKKETEKPQQARNNNDIEAI